MHIIKCTVVRHAQTLAVRTDTRRAASTTGLIPAAAALRWAGYRWAASTTVCLTPSTAQRKTCHCVCVHSCTRITR